MLAFIIVIIPATIAGGAEEQKELFQRELMPLIE